MKKVIFIFSVLFFSNLLSAVTPVTCRPVIISRPVVVARPVTYVRPAVATVRNATPKVVYVRPSSNFKPTTTIHYMPNAMTYFILFHNSKTNRVDTLKSKSKEKLYEAYKKSHK